MVDTSLEGAGISRVSPDSWFSAHVDIFLKKNHRKILSFRKVMGIFHLGGGSEQFPPDSQTCVPALQWSRFGHERGRGEGGPNRRNHDHVILEWLLNIPVGRAPQVKILLFHHIFSKKHENRTPSS